MVDSKINNKEPEKAALLNDELDGLIRDGLENLTAELGTSQDKRHKGRFVNNRRLSLLGNNEELSAMYRTDWLSGKVVDIIPNDMTREWRSFTGEIEPDIVDLLVAEEERLQLNKKINLAHRWARLYGTAFVVISVDDGLLPDKPLELKNIKPGSLKHIQVVDRNRIDISDVWPIQDPMKANFGMPEFYRFHETSTRIHHSRMLRLDGVELPFDEFRRNNYFSDSVLDRMYESILNFLTATDSSASMIYETNVDIYKVENFAALLQTAEGEKMLRKRFTLANAFKSFNNALILDSKEEHQMKNNSFAGLPDLIDRFAQILSAASDVPATRLLGTSASGLNATGEGDLKNYYDKIRADQIAIYKPRLDYFDDIMRASLGLGDETDMSYKFNPLFQMTPKEIADTNFVKAQTDALYLDRDIVTESTVAKELKQDGTYTNITDEDIEELEESEDFDESGFDESKEDLIANETSKKNVGQEDPDSFRKPRKRRGLGGV